MKRWLLPSLMAMLASLMVLEVLSLGPWTIIASTSVASTAVLLFASPHIRAARPWNTLVGHSMGLLAGLLTIPLVTIGSVPEVVPYALSVGASALFMQLSRSQHPPAAGTALTVPAAQLHGGFGPEMAGVILFTVAGLLLLQLPVKRYLPAGD